LGHSQGINFELNAVEGHVEVDLFVSPFSARQRAKPRADQYVFAQYDGTYPRRIQIQPSNSELEDAESIRISIHSHPPTSLSLPPTATKFTLTVNPFDPTKLEDTTSQGLTQGNPGDVQCKNCRQWVPERTLMLHENFCYRNNTLCPKGCGQVFQKSSVEWKNHWHCPHDSSWGNSSSSHDAHNDFKHTEVACPGCSRKYSSLVTLAQHRVTLCPAKLILCRFCHLQVPQEGDPDVPDPAAILSGLTPHELADGARTTECHLCGKIVRLRDMRAHLAHHELTKSSRLEPRMCANQLCGLTQDGTSKNGDTRANKLASQDSGDLGLCPKCFGPLYVALHDPDGKALRRRVERRYLTQLVTGCGKSWCGNAMCRTGRKNLHAPEQGKSIREAMPLVKPLVESLATAAEKPGHGIVPLQFCVDETCQRYRTLAEMLAAEGVYSLEWCVGAVEATGGIGDAREWLSNWAPKKV